MGCREGETAEIKSEERGESLLRAVRCVRLVPSCSHWQVVRSGSQADSICVQVLRALDAAQKEPKAPLSNLFTDGKTLHTYQSSLTHQSRLLPQQAGIMVAVSSRCTDELLLTCMVHLNDWLMTQRWALSSIQPCVVDVTCQHGLLQCISRGSGHLSTSITLSCMCTASLSIIFFLHMHCLDVW